MSMTKADVEATCKPRYTKWARVPDGLKTKTQWRGEGMHLRPDAEPAGFFWSSLSKTHYALYTPENVHPMRAQRVAEARPLTPESIGAALFEINKAAKRRRDAAASSYAQGRYALASTRRSQKEHLYDLKEQVLIKAVSDGIARRVGYHLKFDKFESRKWQSALDT